MPSITLNFDSNNELLAALMRIYPGTDFGQTTKVEPPKSKPAVTQTASVTGTTTQAAPAASEAAAASPSEAPKSVAAAPTPSAVVPTATVSTAEAAVAVNYDQVKAAILKVVSTKGNAAAAAVLNQFGVTKGPALKPEQYAAVVAACEVA